VRDQQRSLLLLKTTVTNLSLSYNFLFWSLNCLKISLRKQEQAVFFIFKRWSFQKC